MVSNKTKIFFGFGLTKETASLRVSTKIASWIGDYVGPRQPIMLSTSSEEWRVLGFFYIVSCLVVYETRKS